MTYSDFKKEFISRVVAQPALVRSPGRINVIGEHTDYNDGFVLPTAIDKEIVFAIAPNDSEICRIYASDLDESVVLQSSVFSPPSRGWAKYMAGILDLLRKSGHELKGFDCLFGGNIPLGAGLSSSAALSCGFAFALNELFELGLTRRDFVLMGQETEHAYVGLQCGVMDQFASVYSKSGNVIELDCRTLDYKYVPLGSALSFVLINSRVTHQLAESEYNVRRKQCEEGVKKIQTLYPEVQNLRDVSFDHLKYSKSLLSELEYKRCRFVLEENLRVHEAAQAITDNAINQLGKLMYASHRGLRHEYEVTCRETDFLVDLAVEYNIAGARQMGGGFGGCTLNLASGNNFQDKIAKITSAYEDKFSITPEVIEVNLAGGTSVIDH